MLKNIEPGQPHVQQGFQSRSTSKLDDFAGIMSAFGQAGVEAASQTSGQNTATMTSAVVTGVTHAASGSNTYGMTTASPFSSGGYGVPGSVGSGYGGAGLTPVAGGSSSFGTGGTSASGLPTDPFLQQNFLLDKMRDTNMSMITLQAEVQSINREFTTLSNVIKAKHDTEIGTIRNIRAA